MFIDCSSNFVSPCVESLYLHTGEADGLLRACKEIDDAP